MRTLLILIFITGIMIIGFCAGCGGDGSPPLTIDGIRPSEVFFDRLRVFIRGPLDKNFDVFVNGNLVEPEVVYWDDYYEKEHGGVAHWVYVITLTEKSSEDLNLVEGENTIRVEWGKQYDETTFTFTDDPFLYNKNWFSIKALLPNGKISPQDVVIITCKGLPSSESDKDVDVWVQLITVPEGEVFTFSLKNGNLTLDGEKIIFIVPDLPQGDVLMIIGTDKYGDDHETDNYICVVVQ